MADWKGGKAWTNSWFPELHPDAPRNEQQAKAFWAFVDTESSKTLCRGERCWLWTGATKTVRGRTTGVAQIDTYRHTTAPRVAWMLLRGRLLNSKVFVLHHCDDPLCVNPNHLFLGTQKDNMKDKLLKGRNGKALNPDSVRAIRAERAAGKSAAEIAQSYGITRDHVHTVVDGRTWAVVK